MQSESEKALWGDGVGLGCLERRLTRRQAGPTRFSVHKQLVTLSSIIPLRAIGHFLRVKVLLLGLLVMLPKADYISPSGQQSHTHCSAVPINSHACHAVRIVCSFICHLLSIHSFMHDSTVFSEGLLCARHCREPEYIDCRPHADASPSRGWVQQAALSVPANTSTAVREAASLVVVILTIFTIVYEGSFDPREKMNS